MTLKLYGNLVSQPCRAVAWLLKVKGVDFELVFTRPPRTVPPEFSQLNPNKQIPVLQDGDFSLYESNAILTYLAEKYKWDDVYPTEPRPRAKVNEYLHWHHTNARVGTPKVFAPILRKSVGKAPPEELALIRDRDAIIGKYVALIETFLGQHLYLANSQHPTLADYACYCEVDQFEIMDVFDFSRYPKTHAWMGRMKALPHHDEVRLPLKEFLLKFKLYPVPKELLE